MIRFVSRMLVALACFVGAAGLASRPAEAAACVSGTLISTFPALESTTPGGGLYQHLCTLGPVTWRIFGIGEIRNLRNNATVSFAEAGATQTITYNNLGFTGDLLSFTIAGDLSFGSPLNFSSTLTYDWDITSQGALPTLVTFDGLVGGSFSKIFQVGQCDNWFLAGFAQAWDCYDASYANPGRVNGMTFTVTLLNQDGSLYQSPRSRSSDVPAPGGLALFLGALCGLAAVRRVRRG
jgi:hypothetical protein